VRPQRHLAGAVRFPYFYLQARIGLRRHPERSLRPLQDAFRGRRAFLIGNGPSLNETPVERLRDELTFGVNNIYLHFERMGFQPTFYFAEDPSVIRHHRDDIDRRVTESCKVFPYAYRRLVRGDGPFRTGRGGGRGRADRAMLEVHGRTARRGIWPML